MLKHGGGRKAENYLSASSERSEASHGNQLTFFVESRCCIRKSDLEKGCCKTKYDSCVNKLLKDAIMITKGEDT